MRQRGGVGPSIWKLDRGSDRDLVCDRVSGIQNQLVPVHVSLYGSGGIAWTEIISGQISPHQAELGYQHICSRGNRNVEAVHIHRIAQPVDHPAVGGKAQVYQVADRTGGCMVSRNPFGVYKIDGVSLRCSNGESFT